MKTIIGTIFLFLSGCGLSQSSKKLNGYWQGYSDSSGYFEINFDSVTHSFDEKSGFDIREAVFYIEDNKMYSLDNGSGTKIFLGVIINSSDSSLQYVYQSDTILLNRLFIDNSPLLRFSVYDNVFYESFRSRKNKWLGIEEGRLKTIDLNIE